MVDDNTAADPHADATSNEEGKHPLGLSPLVVQYATAGLQFATGIVVFLFLGEYLDRRFGTTPWLVIIGAFFGAAAGFFALYRKLTNASKRIAERRFHHSAHH